MGPCDSEDRHVREEGEEDMSGGLGRIVAYGCDPDTFLLVPSCHRSFSGVILRYVPPEWVGPVSLLVLRVIVIGSRVP